jgi:hypothetical protein
VEDTLELSEEETDETVNSRDEVKGDEDDNCCCRKFSRRDDKEYSEVPNKRFPRTFLS